MKTILTFLQIFAFFSILSGLGVNYVPPPDTTLTSDINLHSLSLPNSYNQSYVLGIYDGGHKDTSVEFKNGFILGLTFNSLSFFIAPISTPNPKPVVIPAGVNHEDYIRGYSERSASLNRHAAFKGAVSGSVIQTAVIVLIIALSAK